MKLSRREVVANNVVLIAFSLFAVIPLVGVLLSSLTPSVENSGGFSIPKSLVFSNYGDAWTQGSFGSYLMSSVTVTVAVVALTAVLGIFAGFGFSRFRFRGSGILFGLIVIGMALPSEAFIIPLYFNLRDVGLTDSYWALILPQTAQSLGFAVFWMRNQFRAFPLEIIEAARLDGASDTRVLWQIMVPPMISQIGTMLLLVMMWTWNEFLIPLVMIVSTSRKTAPLGLASFQGQHLTNYSLLSAAGVMVAIPVVLIYFIMQKKFISGVAGGISLR
ncbi:carbohydrate ABC transporter permease [Bifidobacterium sp.]|uniref:carbohydrate ABC transporter permease n=1 Tax=Bifidobacterium sp. TaxID=41200 RepID=UPI0039ED028E